jgi:hypothetical protein
MIPVNELRVGNIVTLTGNEVASPLDIMIDEVNFPITRKRGEYNPIPISPEWLERFGLERQGDFITCSISENQCNEYRSLELWNTSEGIEICLHDDSLELSNAETMFYDLPHIQHVHQLQNLYHSLTGKELELKEKV